MKTLPALALLALAAATHAADTWVPLIGDVSFAPSSVVAPAPDMRRVVLKIADVVALYEYDCVNQTAAMLYVMRPGRDPYVPSNNRPQPYKADSVHGAVSAGLCKRGWL